MNLPAPFQDACERWDQSPTNHCLYVNIAEQTLTHFHDKSAQILVTSTAARGTGQKKDSNKTPLGLHRIAEKIGENKPIGTIFKGRKAIATNGKGNPNAMITDRILWLEGLEPNLNRGGELDSHQRYIYIHGTGDESRLGQPNSQGCIHLAAVDLLPLFDRVTIGTLVYISKN
jgi:lipoprotein-anchoring transpeptidase ErfK/SrfK